MSEISEQARREEVAAIRDAWDQIGADALASFEEQKRAGFMTEYTSDDVENTILNHLFSSAPRTVAARIYAMSTSDRRQLMVEAFKNGLPE